MVLEPEMMRKIADMSDKHKMCFFRILTWFAENDPAEDFGEDENMEARIEQLIADLENSKATQ